MKQFKKILCPYDFSEHAEEALLYALKLADTNTELTLLYVIQLPYSLDVYGFPYYDEKAKEYKEEVSKKLEAKIDELKAKYPNINSNFLLKEDLDPANQILEVQKDNNYEVVVMGSHGRKGLQRLLMGSVAELVMRDATCPVLVIKR